MTPRAFANQRLDAILARPGMWGGPEAIELQALLMLELLVNDALPDHDPHEWIRDRYLAYIRAAVSGGPWLLSGHALDVDSLVAHLVQFRALVSSELTGPPRSSEGRSGTAPGPRR